MSVNTLLFERAYRSHIKFLKEGSSYIDSCLRAIPAGNFSVIPVGGLQLGNQELNAEFRGKSHGLSLEEFILNPNKIALVIVDPKGSRCGFFTISFDNDSFHLKGLIDSLAIDVNQCKIESLETNISQYFYNTCGINLTVKNLKLVTVDLDYVPDSLILTAGPSISNLEVAYAHDAASRGWNGEWSKYLTKFESEFAKYVGAKYALATSSCTGALQIALMSLNIGSGDEVIVPDETWVATANAVRYVGAIPIFADIELDTWNIDASSIESLITPKTKAVIAVHMYGHPARMSKILDVARRHGLKVVEDAAPAIGAEWEGQRCGSFGDFAAFSFQGAKLLVTGEGGMLVTNDDVLYEKAKKIWDQGRNPSKVFWIDGDGVKFKMSNIQAALGLGQLERADELIEMKRRLFSWYEEGLADLPYITLNKEVEGARSIYWMSSLFLDEVAPISRDELMRQLKSRNIDTRPVFPAISQYPIWPRHQKPQPTALRVGLRAINLPSGVCLTKDEVMYVCRNIAELIK